MALSTVLITLGCLFIVGLATDLIGRRTRLPRVTLLILFGVLAGPAGFDVVPAAVRVWYEPLAAIALTMVAFLLGGALSLETLRKHGREILAISATVVILTLVLVGGGLMLLGVAPALALMLAGIATATAPAATEDVLRQTGARGAFAQTLRGIVAVDDAWGLIAFSIVLVAASMLVGNGLGAAAADGLYELAGAALVGAVIGLPAAYLTGRLRGGDPIQAEALAVVLLCAGLSLWLEVSFLLAGIVAGAIVVNLARHHSRPFHEIEHIEWPFMILFFFLAGASLEPDGWWTLAWLVGAFAVLRIVARLIGGWLGGWLGNAPPATRRWIGAALMPQAGVAVGMALVAGDHFPELRDTILTVTIGVTVLFEVFGPLATRVALARADGPEEA